MHPSLISSFSSPLTPHPLFPPSFILLYLRFPSVSFPSSSPYNHSFSPTFSLPFHFLPSSIPRSLLPFALSSSPFLHPSLSSSSPLGFISLLLVLQSFLCPYIFFSFHLYPRLPSCLLASFMHWLSSYLHSYLPVLLVSFATSILSPPSSFPIASSLHPPCPFHALAVFLPIFLHTYDVFFSFTTFILPPFLYPFQSSPPFTLFSLLSLLPLLYSSSSFYHLVPIFHHIYTWLTSFSFFSSFFPSSCHTTSLFLSLILLPRHSITIS